MPQNSDTQFQTAPMTDDHHMHQQVMQDGYETAPNDADSGAQPPVDHGADAPAILMVDDTMPAHGHVPDFDETPASALRKRGFASYARSMVWAGLGGAMRVFVGAFAAIFSALVLGAIACVIGLGGLVYIYSQNLPDHQALSNYTPPTISRIYSREGLIVDEFAVERRLFLPSEEIPDIVAHAFVSAEDRFFYDHSGYDPRAMVAAIVEAIQTRGQTVRGASTITQQVMKNFLLDSSRTIERKVQEIILAARIETTLSKDQILELYLNEIFLGQNSYGVAAAAQTYFNADLRDLRLEQVAYLAALPQAPSNFHPVDDYERAINRRNYVLREMAQNGYITQDEMRTAQAAPLETVQGGHIEPFRASLPPRGYFTDEIRRQLSDQYGEEEFLSGGYSVRSTMDEGLQEVAERALRRALEAHDRDLGLWRGAVAQLPQSVLGAQQDWRDALAALELARDIDTWHLAVVLAIENGAARIGIEGLDTSPAHIIPASDVTWARPVDENGNPGRAARDASDLLAVGDVVYVHPLMDDRTNTFLRWSLRQIPETQGGFMAMDVNSGRVLAMQGGFSYQDSSFNRVTQAQRQPGSSFKPFVYAAALDVGYSPNTIILDAPIAIETGEGIWRPQNASDRFYGPAPLRTGIEFSRNLMTVRLARDVTMETVADYAEHFGVYDEMDPFISNALGSQETTLFRMVAAYAMFANGGERVEPGVVDRIQDRWGNTIYRHDQRECVNCDETTLAPDFGPRVVSNRERVIDPITAYQLTSMMRGVVDRGTAASTVNLPVPTAGKTGTTNDARDVWFVGYTSNIAAGCYIGYDQPSGLGRGAGGGSMCGPVFNEFMQAAIEEYGGGEFARPDGGVFYPIDRVSGQRLESGASGRHVVYEMFREGQEPYFGALSVIDGGWGMSSDLPMETADVVYVDENGNPVDPDEVDDATARPDSSTVVTSTGQEARVPTATGFGTLSAGGLY